MFSVGDSVLCRWKDGKKYSAIVRNVDFIEIEGGSGGLRAQYTIEFDDGEVYDDVHPDRVEANN